MSSLTEFLKNITIRKYARLKLWNEVNQAYFKETGWYNSFKSKASLDKNNKPQPWLSCGANMILVDRLKSDFSIYEFGSGNSTLYFAQKVNEVVSVEHDDTWFQKIKSSMPANVNLVYKKLDSGQYETHIKDYKEHFDIVIVDGRKRVDCARNSVESLKPDGVLIFDDFDREKYHSAKGFFNDNGYKCLEFWGMSAGSTRLKSTAIFYKENNCLGF